MALWAGGELRGAGGGCLLKKPPGRLLGKKGGGRGIEESSRQPRARDATPPKRTHF